MGDRTYVLDELLLALRGDREREADLAREGQGFCRGERRVPAPTQRQENQPRMGRETMTIRGT